MTEDAPASRNEEHCKEQCEEEIKDLRYRLELAERKNTELSQQLELQNTQNKQLLLEWKLKLDASNDLIAAQAKERDQQLSEITSDLFYFESWLLKKNKGTKTAFTKKHKQIQELERKVKHQDKQINALNRANERLLTSLHDLRDNYEERKRGSVSGYDSDDTLCEKDNSVTGVEMPVRSHELDKGRDIPTTSARVIHGHHQNGFSQNNRLNVPSSSSQIRLVKGRTRKLSDLNGRAPCTLYNLNTNNIPLPRSPQLSNRFRYKPEVTEIQEEDEKEAIDIVKPILKLRKISLPAYHLPITDDEKEEYI
ncbi:uncharacterized protein [Apostichopus japonicus]|uniref:uncharacterized protein n=1 Tax=Stichopus japonicus TaxID=307972 RepID=UPI003AB212C0